MEAPTPSLSMPLLLTSKHPALNDVLSDRY